MEIWSLLPWAAFLILINIGIGTESEVLSSHKLSVGDTSLAMGQ